MIYNKLTDDDILELLKNNKCPIKSFIERNKYLARKTYIARSEEIEWVVDKDVAEYIPELIEKIYTIKQTKWKTNLKV